MPRKKKSDAESAPGLSKHQINERIRYLIRQSKEQGYLTSTDINEALPEGVDRQDDIDNIGLPILKGTEEIVEYCNDNNIRIYVYTVNEIKQIRYLRELGVSGVFTDFPKLIR